MKKRRHHYVWRAYLRPWSSNEKIWCHREGKTFNSNLMGIGQERDFYKLKQLTDKDIALIKLLAIDNLNPRLKKLNEGWLSMFNAVFKIKKQLLAMGLDQAQANDLLEEPIHNIEEDFHGAIESRSLTYLNQILNDDLNFFQNDEASLDFIFFLCVQYFRTNAIKRRILDALEGEKYDISNCWNILSHVFATNVGWSLYSEREQFRLVLLKASGTQEIISGDQPVLNTFGNQGEKQLEHDEFEFYYPVSPHKAILLTKDTRFVHGETAVLDDKTVSEYNAKIIGAAHNQVYASSETVLEDLFKRL